MKRREFLSVVGGAVVVPLTLPSVARAHQGERVRVVGLLTLGVTIPAGVLAIADDVIE